MKLTIATDPGGSGAIAIITDLGSGSPTLAVYPFAGYADALDTYRLALNTAKMEGVPIAAFLEDVGFHAGVNGSAMCKLNRNAGWHEGALQALDIPLHMVRPQKWQAGIRGTAGTTGADRKRALREEARRRYPQARVTLETCDAILLADWGHANGSH